MILYEWQKWLCAQLQSKFDASEARQLSNLLIRHYTGAKSVDIITSSEPVQLPKDALEHAVQRLLNDEPWQYVLGETDFCNLTIKVNTSVLIPRPETEEMVLWICQKIPVAEVQRIIDVCSGSGCIALALKKHFTAAYVQAWEWSPKAMEVSQLNANLLQLDIDIRLVNALEPKSYNQPEPVDVIVSNPPYVAAHEARCMHANVLKYEPHEALFVPDDDTLLFYRAIAQGAYSLLRPGGHLFFEINESKGQEVCQLLTAQGWQQVELKTDFRGKDRMVYAQRPKPLT